MKNSMFLTRQTRKRDIHLHAKYTTWLMFWGLYTTQKESPRRISDSQTWRLPTLRIGAPANFNLWGEAEASVA